MLKPEHLNFLSEMGFKTLERVDMVSGYQYWSDGGPLLLVTDESLRSVSIHSESTGKCLSIIRDFRYGGMDDLREFISMYQIKAA